MGLTRFYLVSVDFCCVSLCFTMFHRVLLWFYSVLEGITGLNWVSEGFHGFQLVLLGFAGFYWVWLGLT